MADLNQYLTIDSSSRVKLHEQRDRIRSASVEELREVLQDVQMEVLTLREKSMMEQLSNPMRLRHIRKLVARIHTELAARERNTASAA